jgi:hypothetical protein
MAGERRTPCLRPAAERCVSEEGPAKTTSDLRELLLILDPKARNHLRHVLIRDDADRDAIASMLMRYCDENGQR